MKLTPEEIEECNYEWWLMTNGPQKAEIKQYNLAKKSIKELEEKGYKILEENMVKKSFDDYKKMEIVVRKKDSVKLLQWNTFNEGWMEKYQDCSGSGIFID